MQVKDLIEWLKTQPQDVVVEVVHYIDGRYPEDHVAYSEPFDATKHASKRVQRDKIILTLGILKED